MFSVFVSIAFVFGFAAVVLQSACLIHRDEAPEDLLAMRRLNLASVLCLLVTAPALAFAGSTGGGLLAFMFATTFLITGQATQRQRATGGEVPAPPASPATQRQSAPAAGLDAGVSAYHSPTDTQIGAGDEPERR